MEAEATQIETINEEFSLDEKISIYERALEKGSFIEHRELGEIPLLNKDEEIEFAKRIENGGKKFKEYFLIANLGLVTMVAKDFYKKNSKEYNFQEKCLMQEGAIGLMFAINKFDYKEGYRFSTFAVLCIEQKIRREANNQGRSIRLPEGFARQLWEFKKRYHEYYKEFVTEPTIEEMAEKMDITTKKAQFLQEQLEQTILSIDKPLSNEYGEFNWNDIIQDRNFGIPEEIVLKKIYSEEIIQIIEKLEPREKYIIKKRYGFSNSEPKSLDAIGKKFGLTRERIRQIEERALDKIKIRLIQQEPLMIEEVLNKFSEKEKGVLKTIFNVKNNISKRKIGEIYGLTTNEVKKLERKGLKEIVGHYIKNMT
jgi:RNA polymerase primary sigma factor